MGELRRYQYKEVSRREKQSSSSLLSDKYFAVLSNVCSVYQRKPRRADAGEEMPGVLRKTDIFISGASADGRKI